MIFVIEDFLGVGGFDDDFGMGVGNMDFIVGVIFFSEFLGEEVVEFGLENIVGDEFFVFVNDLRGRYFVSC